MALSWNEIKERAIAFSKEWAGTKDEDADAKSFLDAFFEVFGVSRRRVATFECKVTKLDNRDGYIDMLWKGNILIEMKSRGKDLDKAYKQAKDYFPGLKEHELPKYILVCDFHTFRLYDLESGRTYEFTIDQLYKKVNLFGFIAGYGSTVEIKEQDPVNTQAAEQMGKLHDSLKAIGYEGHDLEVYLVRILFCMFADDTTIFNKNIFYDYILNHSSEDGSNLASIVNEIFEILNTSTDKRLRNISEELAVFPYVNGRLFEERLPLASFDRKMRDILLNCCTLDWGKISPAIFGSMFQSVMNPAERRNLGAHYTSETNILKLIKPLFLDGLWKEFEKYKNNTNELKKLHGRIASLRVLDPACGCGNFLVVTYRELRLLELEILKVLYGKQRVFDVKGIVLCDVDQFYGIEYEEFPAQIAQVALWLIDHQMNMLCSQEFGEYFVRLPLKKSATIIHGDALETDWAGVVPQDKLSYILGNPPFSGSRQMTKAQREQVIKEFNGQKGAGDMDYVSAWYIKASKYIQNSNIKVALVSTNSIVQGEQVGILWAVLLNKYGIRIHFAHRTFKWSNEAKGNAAVFCIIIGFAAFDTADKTIFEYEDIKGAAHEVKVKNINPYLVDFQNILLTNKSTPISTVPKINYGSFALDHGYYTLNEDERNEIITVNSDSIKLIRSFIGGRELLHSEKRFCLWLYDITPNDIKSNANIKNRIELVRKWRLSSDRANTKALAETPTLFAEVRQSNSNYLALPTTSSENRKYIPIAFLSPEVIASNQLYVVPNAKLYHFGILTSIMHMTWVKNVCGRLKSDYRYSASIVYNNFPWPQTPADKQIAAIEEKAQKVLDVRAMFPDSSLADLYDPLTMPPALVKAHNDLDRAVDAAYRPAAFPSETTRMEYLFNLYDQYTATIFVKSNQKR